MINKRHGLLAKLKGKAMQFSGEIDVHINDPAHSAVIYFDDTASELSWINCCRSQNAGELLHA
jgi:hypothetical protein